MDELKPCPFCGGTGVLSSNSCCIGHGEYIDETFIRCKECGARGKTITDRDIGKKEQRKQAACIAWDTRAE